MRLEPGITCVVGPNGSGKSNVVEAIAWVLGEQGAKALRGGKMEDVIFAGTTGRPARNLAEVTLLLDNSKREAPAAFNDSDELEVTRRIARGSVSSYFVNGREVRARDVHLLFADAATGAHSTAVVGQGHIGDLIKGKPADRRACLLMAKLEESEHHDVAAAREWLARATDADGDGLMDNARAGAGAIEVGDLGVGLKSDVYMAAVWVKALEALPAMARAMGDSAFAREADALHAKALAACHDRYTVAP